VGTRTGRPLFLAEFGTSNNVDLDSRVRWTRCNRRLAEEHAIPWGIWSLGPSFAIYDLTARAFNKDLLAANGLTASPRGGRNWRMSELLGGLQDRTVAQATTATAWIRLTAGRLLSYAADSTLP
jgi:hypothetical protein